MSHYIELKPNSVKIDGNKFTLVKDEYALCSECDIEPYKLKVKRNKRIWFFIMVQ